MSIFVFFDVVIVQAPRVNLVFRAFAGVPGKSLRAWIDIVVNRWAFLGLLERPAPLVKRSGRTIKSRKYGIFCVRGETVGSVTGQENPKSRVNLVFKSWTQSKYPLKRSARGAGISDSLVLIALHDANGSSLHKPDRPRFEATEPHFLALPLLTGKNVVFRSTQTLRRLRRSINPLGKWSFYLKGRKLFEVTASCSITKKYGFLPRVEVR